MLARCCTKAHNITLLWVLLRGQQPRLAAWKKENNNNNCSNGSLVCRLCKHKGR